MTRYRIKIVPDEGMNPREEHDNLGTMACWHRRYDLGDVKPKVGPAEYCSQQGISKETHVILPLYLYEHGGITIATTPFSCPWDSGQVGFIYAARGAEGMTDEQLEACLKGEVDTYDAYLTGEIYGFVLERGAVFTKHREDGKTTKGVDWVHESSCFGFFRDPRDDIRGHIDDAIFPALEEAYKDIGEWAEVEVAEEAA